MSANVANKKKKKKGEEEPEEVGEGRGVSDHFNNDGVMFRRRKRSRRRRYQKWICLEQGRLHLICLSKYQTFEPQPPFWTIVSFPKVVRSPPKNLFMD